METESLREAVEGVMALRSQNAQPKLAEKSGKTKLDVDHKLEEMRIQRMIEDDEYITSKMSTTDYRHVSYSKMEAIRKAAKVTPFGKYMI